jgi:cysteinyl-tRNA synthetase
LETARVAAMKSKDFSQVDQMKAMLTGAGVEVRMSKAGVDLLPSAGFDATKLEPSP